MAFSTQRAVSDGTLQDLLLEIKYIDKEDINVFIDDVPQVLGVDYTWISDVLLRFTAVVPNESEVLLQRATKLDNVLNIFTLGAVFDDPTMDENFRQMLYIAQEAREGSTLEEIFTNLNMHGYRVQNLGAGTEPGDAINYQQYMDDSLGAGGARAGAEAARNAAQAAQAAAATSASAAGAQAGIATSQANAAASSAASANAAAAETEADKVEIQNLYDAIANTPGGGMKPLLYVEFAPSRLIIQAGYAAADGQLLSRSTYADAFAQATAAGLVVSDAAWLADPTKRGMYSSGDGSTTFRLPDYNGRFAGSLGAVFLRGDGALSAAVAGVIQRDSVKAHDHSILASGRLSASVTGHPGRTAQSTVTFQQLSASPNIAVDNATSTEGGAETRPLNVTGCLVIKLFGAVVNVGAADAAQLASDYANLAATLSTLASQLDCIIIYPNSGSAGAPANVVVNSRYVETNPFAGYSVLCKVELFVNGEWGAPGWISNAQTANTFGVTAAQHADQSIVVQTAPAGLTGVSALTGGTFPSLATAVTAPTPCRVKVWKVKGAVV